ncbi:uncharacterized protein [Haliotis asinina]|uniref:uncharacterized protein n=1 Tax=Haliotis asinina TaxID=109174 RepID=UPI0035322605
MPNYLTSTSATTMPNYLISTSATTMPNYLTSTSATTMPYYLTSTSPTTIPNYLISTSPTTMPNYLTSTSATTMPNYLTSTSATTMPNYLSYHHAQLPQLPPCPITSPPPHLPPCPTTSPPPHLPPCPTTSPPPHLPPCPTTSATTMPNYLISTSPTTMPNYLTSTSPTTMPNYLTSTSPTTMPNYLTSTSPTTMPNYLISTSATTMPNYIISTSPTTMPYYLTSTSATIMPNYLPFQPHPSYHHAQLPHLYPSYHPNPSYHLNSATTPTTITTPTTTVMPVQLPPPPRLPQPSPHPSYHHQPTEGLLGLATWVKYFIITSKTKVPSSTGWTVTMFLAPAHIALSKSPEKVTNSSIIKKFPVKFWRIVNSCKTGAVCWGFGGNSIRILKEKFEEEYLFGENKPFKTATFSSFIRQLNLYGFRKIVRPSIINEHGQKLNTSLVEYKHPMFLKGHPELLRRIHRNTKTQKRREKKIPSGESRQSVTVCVSDPKLKKEVREDGYGYSIQGQVIKEDGVSACQDVTNLQDRTSGKSAPCVSVPDQAAPPSSFPSCSGQTLVSVQLPVAKQPLFRQPHSRNMVRFATRHYGHAVNTKPSIQQIPPANINRPNSANADVPHLLQGHNQNTGPLDMIKLEPCLDSVKPNTGIGRQIHQVCEALPLVPKYGLNTSDGPIQGLMLDTTRQQSNNIILNPNQKPQPVSCTVGTLPIQPCQVQTHPHVSAVSPGLIPNESEPIRHNVFPGHTQRHPVLYINKSPSIPIAPRPTQFQRPPLRPQLYDNVKPNVQEKDNAGCSEMATHPLLRPVRQTFDCASVSSATDTTTYSQYVLKPNTHFQSIPLDTSSASEHTESNVSLDDDGLVDLTHFKLSSTLKDIDAPCGDNMEVDNYNSHHLSTSYIIHTSTSGDTTITSSVPATEQTYQVPEHNLKIPSENSFSAPAKDDNQICSEDSKACSSSPATAFWELTTLTPSSTGPKRQLFKDSVTRRLTIPVSGLPRDLFSVPTAAGEILDQSEAVITLETSEDGHVTGHLILPGKDAKGTKSTEQ